MQHRQRAPAGEGAAYLVHGRVPQPPALDPADEPGHLAAIEAAEQFRTAVLPLQREADERG